MDRGISGHDVILITASRVAFVHITMGHVIKRTKIDGERERVEAEKTWWPLQNSIQLAVDAHAILRMA